MESPNAQYDTIGRFDGEQELDTTYIINLLETFCHPTAYVLPPAESAPYVLPTLSKRQLLMFIILLIQT
jgi:hypothetical protein